MTFSSLKPGAKRTCKNRACRNKFVPTERHPFAIACCTGCEIILAKQHIEKVQAARAKKERKELKVRKEAIKPLGYFLKKAETAFNTFIRKRDEGRGCISCGRHDATVWNAGHFKSVGAHPELRFNEDNVHLQCARPCNKDKGGNIHGYRIGLLAKIGCERVAALETWQGTVKMTIEKAMSIEAEYKGKLKALQGLMGVGE